MTVYIESETEKLFDFDYKAIIENVISAGLKKLDWPYDVQIQLLLTDDESIREINREQRGIDSSTDVLSFPCLNFSEAGDIESASPGPGDFDPDSDELLLGDIVISTDHVYEQAESYGHSLQRELGFLTAHSLLHLFGYDHEEKEEAELMEKLQETILSGIGLTRE